MWQDTESTCTIQQLSLYTNNRHTDKEIIDTFPFIIKYLETNLKKEVKNLDNENLKYLKR